MQIDVSLEEMVQQPLTQADIVAFKQRLVQLGQYENWLFLGFVAVLLAGCGIYYGTFLALGLPAWFAIFSVYVLGFAVFFYFVLVTLPRLSLKKYPTRLVVDGKERLQGTAGMEFEIVAINPAILPEGSQAFQLYNNIVQQGRALVAFEKQLIEEMLALPA